MTLGRLNRVLPAACLAVAAGLAMIACQPVESGAALIIGGERVSVTEIQDRVTAVNEQRRRTGQQAQQAATVTQEQVRRIILSRILDRAAQRAGVSVSQAEIDAQHRQLEEQAGGADAFAKQVAEANVVGDEDLDRVLRDMILQQKLAEKLVPNAATPQQQQERATKLNEVVSTAAKDLGIKVNPRYGRWDPNEFTIAPAVNGFVKPEQEATPAPTPP